METIAKELFNILAASGKISSNVDDSNDQYRPNDQDLQVGRNDSMKTISQAGMTHSQVCLEGRGDHALAGKPSGSISIEVVSAQGLLFESLPNHDVIHSLQIHILYNRTGIICRSPIFDVSDLSKPIICQFCCSFTTEFGSTESYRSANDGAIVILLTDAGAVRASTDGSSLLTQQHQLVAQAVLDERMVQLYSEDYISVELIPCISDYMYSSSESPGVLFIKLSSSTKISKPSTMNGINDSNNNVGSYKLKIVTHEESQLLQTNIATQQATITQTSRDVFQQIKAWWSSLKHEYPHLSGRGIKFITEDECGRHRYVGSFISAITPGRELNGPRFAARLVSLLPFGRETSLAGGRVGRWRSAHASLACLCGDVEDHAILLCSLLLGWGLNAYLALGTIHTSSANTTTASTTIGAASTSTTTTTGGANEQQIHVWVVSFCESGKTTFWESLTAEQHYVNPQSSSSSETSSSSNIEESHYKEVWALFRNDEYLVNIQSSCQPSKTSFDLRNERMWRCFTLERAIWQQLTHPSAILRLEEVATMQSNSAVRFETHLENSLIDWLGDFRRENGLQTFFDEALGTILHPTLASYELDRAAGSTFGNDDFQSSIRRYVRKGECFKAFPTCFSHTNVDTIKALLLRTKTARDVLLARSRLPIVRPGAEALRNAIPRQARLAVRVRVFPYARGIQAVWVVVAACYEGE